jgi:polysaccharide export outer membrane protein
VLFKTEKKLPGRKPVEVYGTRADTSVNYRHRIKVGDRIQPRFLNNYDIGEGAMHSATAAANLIQSGATERGYLVNYDSTVTLPLIGRVNLVGKTRLEAAEILEQEYSKFINNPIVDLNILSLSVTILGEVNVPGKILVDKENTTLVDVIALAGGFKDSGKKKDVKIIRGTQVILVDLKRFESLQSTHLIVHDNDIIYVAPYGAKAALEPVTSVIPAVTLVVSLAQILIVTFQIYTLSRR